MILEKYSKLTEINKITKLKYVHKNDTMFLFKCVLRAPVKLC